MFNSGYRATQAQAISQFRRKHIGESLVSALDAKQACLELAHAAALLDGMQPDGVERRGLSTEEHDGARGRAVLPQELCHREFIQLIQSRVERPVFVFEIVEVGS